MMRLIEVGKRDRHVRALAALLLFLVAASAAGPAPCAMGMAAAEGQHGCCAEGLAEAPPPCCHAQPSTRSSAIVAGHPAPTALPAASGLLPVAVPSVSAVGSHVPAAPHLHSPPPAVLRI